MKTEDSTHLASLRAKLRARDGKKEYEENCKHLREEITRLEGTGREFDL